MCQICEFAASQADASAARFAASATEPGLRRAAPSTSKRAWRRGVRHARAGVGAQGRKVLIKGGAVLSMDPGVGNHAAGDVLLDGSKIVEVAARIDAPDASVIDASGHIVMPGFIDTHHHQFETALRSFLADAILINDGRPESAHNFYELILQKLSMGYRPQDIYINELCAGVAQIDAGVTAVMDVSQIHHSPEHFDAAIEGLRAAGRRAVFGYFEGWGEKAEYPGTPSASAKSTSRPPTNCSPCSWAARSTCTPMRRRGKSAAS